MYAIPAANIAHRIRMMSAMAFHEIMQVLDQFNKKIPEQESVESVYSRGQYTDYISWAVPDGDLIQDIAAFFGELRVLEVGAGNGLWAYLLKKNDCLIHATDAFDCDSSYGSDQKRTFTAVEKLDAFKSVQKYDPEAMFFCWPGQDQSFAADALLEFKGSRVVYIGNPEYTADATFHNILDDETKWQLVKEVDDLPAWPGVYNIAYYYERVV
jgi:hypothetical protein